MRVEATGPDGTRTAALKFCDAGTAQAERHTYAMLLTPTPVRRPQLIDAFVDGERGLLVFTFVPGEQGDVMRGCTEFTAGDIVESIAGLHATWWEREAPGVDRLDPLLRRPVSTEQIDRCLADHHDALPRAAKSVLRSLPTRLDDLADTLAGHPVSVVHGDLHLDNVIIDEMGRATLLDWGRPRLAPGAVDLARCFIEVVDARPSDDLGRRLVARYVAALRNQGVEGYGPSELTEAIHLAHLLFVPGLVRWAAAGRAPRGSRSWALLRQALTRIGGQIT